MFVLGYSVFGHGVFASHRLIAVVSAQLDSRRGLCIYVSRGVSVFLFYGFVKKAESSSAPAVRSVRFP